MHCVEYACYFKNITALKMMFGKIYILNWHLCNQKNKIPKQKQKI